MILKKYIIGVILGIFLFGFSNEIIAQNHIDKDSIKQAKKLRKLMRKEKRQNLKFTVDAVRFGVEGTYAFQGLLSENMVSFYSNVRKIEGSADVTFFDNTLCLMTDVGYWSTLRLANTLANGYQYENDGFYFRTGLDYNILKHMGQKFSEDAIFLGLRFGQARGRHKIRMSVQNIPWNYYTVRDADGDLKYFEYEKILPYETFTANWLEIVTGLRATVWRNIQTGYTFRYKMLVSVKNKHEDLAVNEIPGFGTTELTSKPAFSFHVFYRLPLRKKKNAPSKIEDLKKKTLQKID